MSSEDFPQGELRRLSPLPLTKFRQVVDQWYEKVDTAIVVKFLYETAGRANEIATKGQPEYVARMVRDKETDELRQQVRLATMPMGPRRSDVEFTTYEGNEVMLITMTVLKRREKNHPEIRLARTVALPLGFDPWAKELADYISSLKGDEGIIPYNRYDMAAMLREAGLTPRFLYGAPDGFRMDNILRHLRVDHLQDHYDFRDEELRHFIGWTYTSRGGSPTQINYERLKWRVYVQKLLRPLPTSDPATPSLQRAKSA